MIPLFPPYLLVPVNDSRAAFATGPTGPAQDLHAYTAHTCSPSVPPLMIPAPAPLLPAPQDLHPSISLYDAQIFYIHYTGM